MDKGKAYVSNVQRLCVHDGPGIRTVVFFMGCPLKCKWCQNPEAIINRPVVLRNKSVCTGCGECIDVCSEKARSVNEDNFEIVVDKNKCKDCFKCANSCVFNSLKLSGKEYSVDELVKEVLKDEVFFKNSRGGVTISGGEPLIHGDFVYEFYKKLKERGIHTAVETCGYVKKETVEKMKDVVDLFLYDFKLFDKDVHKEWTGVENTIILENLDYLIRNNQEVIIRVPLIPNVNDKIQFEKIVDYLREKYSSLDILHIMPFHQIGSSKYEQIGINYEMSKIEEQTEEVTNKCKNYAENKGFKVSIGGIGF